MYKCTILSPLRREVCALHSSLESLKDWVPTEEAGSVAQLEVAFLLSLPPSLTDIPCTSQINYLLLKSLSQGLLLGRWRIFFT